ncbi:hypothetical protein [Mumia sp. Pv 4-285]|uniref:hypothetical protein n=1 Tax=Mumia qirimensis TaxID=3234852 RepID=UPI00351D6EAF
MVRFRSGVGAKLVPIVAVAPGIVGVALAAAVIDQGAVPDDAALPVLTTLAVSALFGTAALLASPSHRWDLSRGVIQLGGREIWFREIERVVVFTGFRGWRGMAFFGPAGRVRRLGADLSFGTRSALGRDQWVALRALLAAPWAPPLQAYGHVSYRAMDSEPPLRSVSGEAALRLVDAQIAWIDAGRRSASTESPVGRFLTGR